MRPSAASPVTAVTMTNEVMSVPELVMNALLPLITQASPSTTAVVRVAPASEPPPDSVSPNAPSSSPAHRLGSHRSFSSAEPNRYNGIAPSDTAASSVIATDESTRASSSIARYRANESPPIPPCSTGKGSPNSPIAPMPRTMSYGKAPRS